MFNYTRKEGQGQLKIQIPAKDWESALERAYEKNKGKYNIQGFRKGKAPRRVIEQTYGDTVFFDDAFDEVVGKEYYEFLMKNKDVQPASAPSVTMDSFTADKGVEATLTFDLMPEVTLGSLSGLKSKKTVAKVDAKQINAELERMQSAHARFVEKDKAVQNGDIATIDFSGAVDGVKFEGGTAENHRLEIGSHTFIEGFEEQIVDMKKGETKDINVTFPKEYHAENLKGKPAVFTVTVKKVEEKQLPEINDKFISDTTEFESLEEYKKSLKDKLTLDAEKRAENEYENALIEEVVSLSKVEPPHSMIHDEAHRMMHDFEHRLSHQNMKLDDYLSYTGQTHETFHEHMMTEAEKSIKTRLVLQKIISENKLKATGADIDKQIGEYAKYYNMKLEDVKSTLSEDDKAYFENQVLMTKLLNFIKSKNTPKTSK